MLNKDIQWAIGVSITVILSVIGFNSKFSKLEKQVELMYESEDSSYKNITKRMKELEDEQEISHIEISLLKSNQENMGDLIKAMKSSTDKLNENLTELTSNIRLSNYRSEQLEKEMYKINKKIDKIE